MSRGDQPATRLLHAGLPVPAPGAPFVDGPVFASTYHLPGDPGDTPEAPHYGRYGNPTWTALEAALGALEAGEAVAFASGMAAVTAVLCALTTPGDPILLPADGYFTVRAFAETYLAKWGVVVRTVATPMVAAADVAGCRLVWLETPSNPSLDVCDIDAIATAARAAGALVVVDNTTATALAQQPLSLGADISVAADTKAANGHSDVVFGHVAARDPAIVQAIREWRRLAGAIPGPMETWLVHRGLATLDVRLTRQAASALAIARFLQTHPAVERVRYPGLADDPSHQIAARQMTGFGCLVGVTLRDAETAQAVLAASRLIFEATSFGGVHSSAERRARWGDDVAPGFIRLSVGLEPVDDLIADLEQALAGTC